MCSTSDAPQSSKNHFGPHFAGQCPRRINDPKKLRKTNVRSYLADITKRRPSKCRASAGNIKPPPSPSSFTTTQESVNGKERPRRSSAVRASKPAICQVPPHREAPPSPQASRTGGKPRPGLEAKGGEAFAWRPQKPPGWRWIESHVRDWQGVSAEFLHPVRRLGSPDRVAELQLPRPLLPGLPEARAGRGGSCWDPAKRTGVNLARKTRGGKSFRANLSIRHHERGFCCKAIHFQNDRGQRTWHESASHG